MAQQQHTADVHPDELCPPNKRYDLMDANKKVDLEHVQCPPESKILINIIKNHPLRFSIAASSSVPWIYMAQFWHTLKEDGSKYRLRFMLDKKELSLILDDFRTIFHLPQANDNNHNSFVPPPTFSDMVSFYKQQLGFTMKLKTSSRFKATGLLQPWQTLCKIFSKCLTTRIIGWDQPPLQIMQMMYCFVNNIYVDYAELLWEGIYYSLHHPTSLIPYPRFTKIIVSHYMTIFHEISRRARDMYHNLQDDDIVKNIFNSGRHKDKVGMQIPDWMIIEEMKHTEHYKMYAKVFGLDVPLTQRSTRLTPLVLVPTIEKADEMILQDTLQVSLAEHKSQEEQEARENVELVNKHLASEEIEKLVEGSENVINDSSPPRNDEPQIPDTRLEPRSDKESLEVERTNDEEVEVTNVVIPVNVNEEEDEITDEVYELKRREKGKIVEESRSTPLPTPIRSPRTHTNLVSSDTEKLQELTETHTQTTSSSRSQHTKLSRANRLLSLFKAKPARFKRYKNFFQELQGRYTYLFEHLKERFLSRKSFDTLADHLQEVMVESLPTMVDTHIKEQVKKQVPKQVRDQVPVYVAEGLIMERQKTKEEMERMIAKAILQERGNIQAEISSQIQKAIDHHIPSQVDASVRSYMSGHILHVHPAQTQTLSVLEQQYQLYLSMKDNPQLQQQDIAIWLALQMKFKNLQVQQTTCRPSAVRPRDQDDPHDDAHPEGENSAKRQKTSEYEAYASGESSSGQESRKEILVSPHPRKTTPLVQSHQRDPEAPALSLINQDLLYLKKGSSWPEKIVNKCAKKFNPYARYGVKHWKNHHAKIFYIRKQKEPGKPKEEVPDYTETGLLWSLSVFIRSSVIWERVHDFQLGIESYQQKYGYVQRKLTNDEVEYLKLFEEEIEASKSNEKMGDVYYEEIDEGFVAFGGNSKGGKITGKGKIKTGKLDFKDVYFVKELKFNLFSVSQMCDKKNSVLFTDIECVVLSPDFKLTDESHVLLKVPRKDNMYSADLKNVVP
ncbi:hypothetical protein Tco_0092734 [Tanacetum coccineum]